MGRIPILKETTISEWQKRNDNYFFANFTPASPVRMNIGKTYIVVFDDTEYACECEWSLFGYPKLGIENIDGVLTTGFPFGILARSMYDVQILVTDGNAHTFTIYQEISDGGNEGPIGFIEFMSGPNFPYLPKNFFGWKLAQIQSGSTDEPNVVRIDILQETTLAEMSEVSPGAYRVLFKNQHIGLADGEKFIVEWDGTRYECVCVTIPGDVPIYGLGNFSWDEEFGFDGDDVPFCVMDYPVNNRMAFTAIGAPAPHTIAIYQEIEVV